MNIWSWVRQLEADLLEAGEERVAQLLCDLPHWVNELEHGQVDAALPELLACARQTDNTWLEVFVRHWQLQSRVLQRLEARRWMSEAVDLLERAHREDAAGCPQSQCAVQDLAWCYGLVDGPGYAPERISVSDEALARVDAGWSCYVCIMNQKAWALLDLDRGDEALAVMREHMQAVRRHGDGDPRYGETICFLVEALLATGRLDEALGQLGGPLSGGLFYVTEGASLRASVLAELGRVEEALEALPPFAEVAGEARHWRLWWAAAFRLLEKGGLANDDALGADLAGCAARLAELGVLRLAFDLEARGAVLARARGSREAARAHLARARDLLPSLASAASARERLRELEEQLETPARAPAR